MIAAKIKLVLVLLMSLGAVLGTGLAAYQVLTPKPKPVQGGAEVRSPQRDPEPLKSEAPSRPLTDRYGDPLPPGAIARLGTARFRDGAILYVITFAPDGKTLATTDDRGGFHIWETATGKELLWARDKKYEESSDGVEGLAYTPDGKTLVGARLNEPPCLWDAATGKVLRQFGDQQYRAGSTVLSPDGKTLVCGGRVVWVENDPVVRLFDVSTGQEKRQLKGLKSDRNSVRPSYSPDGKILAIADDDGIHFFNPTTGRQLGLTSLGEKKEAWGNTSELTFSPDGKILLALTDLGRTMWIVEVATRKILRPIPLTGDGERALRIAFLPDGKTLISGHEDGCVHFWDVATWTRTRQFRTHSSNVFGLALSRDGRILATYSGGHYFNEHTVRLWETATGKPLVQYPGPQATIVRLVFSPDSRRVATASWKEAVALWEAASGKMLRRGSCSVRSLLLPMARL